MVVVVLGFGGCDAGSGDGAADAADLARLEEMGQRRLADAQDVAFMLQRLERGNAEERMVAAWALGETRPPQANAPLIAAAAGDEATPVRVNAIAALGKLEGDEILPALAGWLEDDNEEIRLAVLRSLANERFAAAADRVGALYDTAGPTVRAAAVDTLSRMRAPAALPHLVQALGEEEADVRAQAAFGLGKLRDPQAVERLIPLLQDAAWEVRANAAQALGMIGDSAARERVRPLLDDPNGQVRAVAEMALEKLD